MQVPCDKERNADGVSTLTAKTKTKKAASKAKKPVARKSVAKKSVAKKSAATKSVIGKPAVTKSAAAKSGSKKAALRKVAASKDELRQACGAASGLFSAGSKLYQCVAPNGDVLSCKVATQYCIGSLVTPKRPATLLGFATAPFGQGPGFVPDEGPTNHPTDASPGTSTSSSSVPPIG